MRHMLPATDCPHDSLRSHSNCAASLMTAHAGRASYHDASCRDFMQCFTPSLESPDITLSASLGACMVASGSAATNELCFSDDASCRDCVISTLEGPGITRSGSWIGRTVASGAAATFTPPFF